MKCHSNRFESRGAACKVGSGCAESSEASFSIRLMVGDLVLKVGSAIEITAKSDYTVPELNAMKIKCVLAIEGYGSGDNLQTWH